LGLNAASFKYKYMRKWELWHLNQSALGVFYKILMLFVAINVIGDMGNVAFWWASPISRISLNPSILGNAVGADIALILGTVVLLVIALV